MPNQKRFNNLLEAAQPQPPSVAVFLDVLTRISDPQPEVAAHSMYGTMFKAAAVAAKPKGTKAVQSAISKAVLQFEKVRNMLGATSTSLDDWLSDLAKFTLEPSALFDSDDMQIECLNQRKELCCLGGVDIKVRKYKVGSFRTYINGLAKVYNNNAPANHIVSSSETPQAQ